MKARNDAVSLDGGNKCHALCDDALVPESLGIFLSRYVSRERRVLLAMPLSQTGLVLCKDYG